MMLSLIKAIDANAYNKVTGGANLSVKAGVKAGSVEIYKGKYNDDGKVDKKSLAEGTLAAAEYNSVYSIETERDEIENVTKKKMKKISGLDVKVASASMKMPVLGEVEAGIYKDTKWPKNYSLTSEKSPKGNSLKIKELSGLGITTKKNPADNWFFAKAENIECEQEAYDVLTFKGDNLNELCFKVPEMDAYANGDSLYILDSVFTPVNSFLQKSMVEADYEKEMAETISFAHEFDIGAKLELGLEGGVGFMGSEKLVNIGESARRWPAAWP